MLIAPLEAETVHRLSREDIQLQQVRNGVVDLQLSSFFHLRSLYFKPLQVIVCRKISSLNIFNFVATFQMVIAKLYTNVELSLFIW